MAEPMGLTTRNAQLAETRPGQENDRFITFFLGREVFAMDTRFIKEVIQYPDLTEVPLAPAAIRGVINLRGSVVPVVDLGQRFGWGGTDIARRTCVVIVETGQEGDLATLGVLVDQVAEVLEIAPSDVVPAPSFGSRLREDFILGVGKVRGRFIILLNVPRVLCIEELASHALSCSEAMP